MAYRGVSLSEAEIISRNPVSDTDNKSDNNMGTGYSNSFTVPLPSLYDFLPSYLASPYKHGQMRITSSPIQKSYSDVVNSSNLFPPLSKNKHLPTFNNSRKKGIKNNPYSFSNSEKENDSNLTNKKKITIIQLSKKIQKTPNTLLLLLLTYLLLHNSLFNHQKNNLN